MAKQNRAARELEESGLTKSDLLRRVLITAAAFGRCLAYYRAGREPEFSYLLLPDHHQASFWRQANGSFLELAVLEWGKLLGKDNEKHHWRQIASDRAQFESELLAKLAMTPAEYTANREAMFIYRDKFIAHLDYERTIEVPLLDFAKESVWHYCEWVFAHEAATEDLDGLPQSVEMLNKGYQFCQQEARQIFRHALRAWPLRGT